MVFKHSLDRYLTQTPEEYYGIDESWYEEVWDGIAENIIPQEEWDRLESWFTKIEDGLLMRQPISATRKEWLETCRFVIIKLYQRKITYEQIKNQPEPY